jgi:hypothetical protein
VSYCSRAGRLLPLAWSATDGAAAVHAASRNRCCAAHAWRRKTTARRTSGRFSWTQSLASAPPPSNATFCRRSIRDRCVGGATGRGDQHGPPAWSAVWQRVHQHPPRRARPRIHVAWQRRHGLARRRLRHLLEHTGGSCGCGASRHHPIISTWHEDTHAPWWRRGVSCGIVAGCSMRGTPPPGIIHPQSIYPPPRAGQCPVVNCMRHGFGPIALWRDPGMAQRCVPRVVCPLGRRRAPSRAPREASAPS